jgi:glyoxylase-like metal-dependent hydrolase (beta-lactamase superfamily II)/8-oxo-dGTP pyrophosphatase MutT (NUDIX family)
MCGSAVAIGGSGRPLEEIPDTRWRPPLPARLWSLESGRRRLTVRARMLRSASAVLLVTGSGPRLALFLVERAPELKFFGGYLALPGGVTEAQDETPGACALRELREETGVTLPATTLLEVCRIRTPPFAPVRYDTRFFLAELPPGQQPQVAPGELTGGRFWRPAEALAAWRRGEVLIVPPLLILLELLLAAGGDQASFRHAAAALAADYDQGRLHQVRFTPGVVLASLRSPTLPPATTTNCLIVGEERLQIVDPGAHDPDEHQRLFRLLDELTAAGRRLESIVLTHHHVDHVGGVDALIGRYRLPVRAHPLTLSALLLDAAAGQPLRDGERIELGRSPDGRPGWQLRAIHTPGHDPGHLCFHENRYDAVLVGDMLSTVSTIVIDPPEGHMRTYLQSLERLLAEPMHTLYPAHGPAARDGHQLVRGYLRHRQQRESRLIETLRQRAGTVAELLPVVYWDVDARMLPIAARSLLAGLQKLAEEGRASEQDGIWRWRH